MKEKIQDLKKNLDDVTSFLLLQAKKSGISKDRLSKIQEQIYQIKNNSAEKKETLSSQRKSIKNKKVPVNQKIVLSNLYDQKQYEKAEQNASYLIKKFPNDSFPYMILGFIYHQLENKFDAISYCKKAVQLDTNSAIAHLNLGIVLNSSNLVKEAIGCYTKAIELKPDYPEAYYNLANIFKQYGNFNKAKLYYSKALELKTNFTSAHFNLGSTLMELELLKNYKLALKNSVEINEDNFTKKNNLSELAINSKLKAVEAEPKNINYWNSLFYVISVDRYLQCNEEITISNYFKKNYSEIISIFISLLEYKLSLGRKNSELYYSNALEVIGSKKVKIKNNRFKKNTSKEKLFLPKKTIALLHFGRSGTGLLHSLIDNHSKVSSLPSIYLAQFFDKEIWEELIKDGWENLVENFIKSNPVLFDSRDSTPVLTLNDCSISNKGLKEGMTKLGKDKNEYLYLDKTLFKKILTSLLSEFSELDQYTFLKLIHVAYEKTLNNHIDKNIIFYHIHNPSEYAKLNFLHYAPETQLLVMVRDPINSCESWIRNDFEGNDLATVQRKIAIMLLEISDPLYIKNNAVGLRLEDLKENPNKTLPALCNWMGIEEEESLYHMTAQGKKWWGDLSSPKQPAFGGVNKRNLGKVFSQRDTFILKTLFYPFRLKFNYIKEDNIKFQENLKIIRPMIEELFDFERKVIDQSKINKEKITENIYYCYLRSIMIRRWETLNRYQTYPEMLEHLKVSKIN